MTQRRFGLSQERLSILHLDPKVRPIVEDLNRAGIQTFQSCQGGLGHTCENGLIFLVPDSVELPEDEPLIKEIVRKYTSTPFRVGHFSLQSIVGPSAGGGSTAMIVFRGPIR